MLHHWQRLLCVQLSLYYCIRMELSITGMHIGNCIPQPTQLRNRSQASPFNQKRGQHTAGKNKVWKGLRQLHQTYNKIFTSTLQQSIGKIRALSKKESKEKIRFPVSMVGYDKKGAVKVTLIAGNTSEWNNQKTKKRRYPNLYVTRYNSIKNNIMNIEGQNIIRGSTARWSRGRSERPLGIGGHGKKYRYQRVNR